MTDDSRWWTTPEIVISAVVGVCLVAKVWIIRRVFEAEVDVLEVTIPVGLLIPFEVVQALRRAEKKAVKVPEWLAANTTWTVMVVVATALSLLRY